METHIAVVLSGETRKDKANGEAVIQFDVTMAINEVPIWTLRGFELFRGFITPPTIRRKSERGIAWEQILDQAYPIMDAVYRALLASDWLERWPDIPQPREPQRKNLRPDPTLKHAPARAGLLLG